MLACKETGVVVALVVCRVPCSVFGYARRFEREVRVVMADEKEQKDKDKDKDKHHPPRPVPQPTQHPQR
ncbi:MAG TPA: hypothetical protein VGV13_08250 [Methylomirabilota bacterium]|jgi:hypothetical protein|nr:hypothetical protein [Methylomirabilota bacterium]